MTHLLASTSAFSDLAHCGEDASKQLALELLRFLIIKRNLTLSTSPLHVSPGWKVDRLWHAMLLETDLRNEIHQLIGGDVPHSARNATMMCESTKAISRILALNIMHHEGWTPALEFWEEPGTLLDTITPYTVGNMVVFTFPQMTRSMLRQTLAFIPQEGHRKVLDEIRPLPSQAASNKRRQEVQFSVIVQTITGKTFIVDGLTDNSYTEDLKDAVEEKEGIVMDQQRLIFVGKQLEDGRLLSDYHILAGCTIHLVLRLTGC